jgi:hypothetical protein
MCVEKDDSAIHQIWLEKVQCLCLLLKWLQIILRANVAVQLGHARNAAVGTAHHSPFEPLILIDLCYAIGRKVRCDLEQPCAQCVAAKCECIYGTHPLLNTLNRAVTVGAVPLQSTRLESQQPGSLHFLRPTQQSVVNQHNSQGLLPVLGSKKPIEDDLMNLRRRISAIEEHLTSPSTHNTVSKLKPLGGEQDPVQHNQHLNNVQRNLASQDQLLTLNKSRLYGPTHWLHGGHEVGQPVKYRFSHHLLILVVQTGGSSDPR